MTSYFNYIIEANLCLTVLGLFYFFLLRNETNFGFQRTYLIGAVLFSLAVPFLNLSNLLPGSAVTNGSSVGYFTLPEVIIGGGEVAGQSAAVSSLNLGGIISILYVLGFVVLSTIFIYQLSQIIKLYITGKKTSYSDNVELIYTGGQLPTFSFFKALFFDDSIDISPQEKDKVIAHELVHIRQLHSLDIVLLEVSKIILWINPVVWWIRDHIQDVHEYLADEHVVSKTSEKEYSQLLAKMALKQISLPLGHHFNKSITLKRIKMMKTAKNGINPWKSQAAILLTLLMFFAFACSDAVVEDVNEIVQEGSMTADIPEDARQKMEELKLEYPEQKFFYYETDLDNEKAVEKMKSLDSETIAAVFIHKEENKMGILVKQNNLMESVADNTKNEDEVYAIVEEIPIPENGTTAFYTYVKENLKYPEQAKTAGKEGKVYVQFVVDTDGSITEVEVVKGAGEGFDEAAAEVMRNAPNWIPGKQKGKPVKVRMVMPIKFTLG